MEIVTALLTFSLAPATSATYWIDRVKILSKERCEAIGSSIRLTEKELLVNAILMELKYREFEDSFVRSSPFLPSVHFFRAKPQIENSEVFKFIRKLPKGASLHSHDFAMASHEVLYNLTFRDNLYVCEGSGNFSLRFFFNSTDDSCEWKLLSGLRERNSSFDDYLKSALTLIVDDPDKVYPDANAIWAKFETLFDAISFMIRYKPVFQDYFYQALREFHEDNVMYVEFRFYTPYVYDAENIYGMEEMVGLQVATLEKFKADHPEFFNARMIFSPPRKVCKETFADFAATALRLRELYPDFVAGFDLVGQEDLGKPLSYFFDQLVELAGKLKFFFHAGETNWNGGDYNLIDAVLLNTTRIGHGYSILKHPEVMKMVKERRIPIELNPISNQVLGLVRDLRDHTGAHLMADGYPVVVSCDDPGFWGAKALSYDWYMAFMGMTGVDGDLRVLKQLALNSLHFSAMDDEEKQCAVSRWEKKWDEFLDGILAETKLS